jgi:hypothetical protein
MGKQTHAHNNIFSRNHTEHVKNAFFGLLVVDHDHDLPPLFLLALSCFLALNLRVLVVFFVTGRTDWD